MTVQVKKGSFTITAIELLILRNMMAQPHCLCQDNEACKARYNVFVPVHEAMNYSSGINCAPRLNMNSNVCNVTSQSNE